MNVVWLQSWEESEAGWGTRPDGFSLHLTQEAAKEYADNFMKSQHDRLGDATPAEYDRPAGSPYEVNVNDEIFADIDEKGLRVFKGKMEQPEPVDPDKQSGWRPKSAN